MTFNKKQTMVAIKIVLECSSKKRFSYDLTKNKPESILYQKEMNLSILGFEHQYNAAFFFVRDFIYNFVFQTVFRDEDTFCPLCGVKIEKKKTRVSKDSQGDIIFIRINHQ